MAGDNKAEMLRKLTRRHYFLFGFYIIAMLVLLCRIVFLQVLDKEFLQGHGNSRALRTVEIPAHRGAIVDRNNEPLAMSTPVASIWVKPGKLVADDVNIGILADSLQMDKEQLDGLLEGRLNRQFVYLKRHVTPSFGKQIMSLDLPGVALQKEYRRYYPAGQIAAHVIGFTNIDGIGQEGIELAYNDWLEGSPGSKRVLKDRYGRVVENIENISMSDPGKRLNLSVDRRLQYLAYRELKGAIDYHKALAGTLVLADVHTGEIIALVCQPSYNPNNRFNLKSSHYRNRAITDVFEPGSTLKPFTVATALESGLYDLQSTVDTRPGLFKIGEHEVSDSKDNGIIDLGTIIKISSNIGISKVALSFEPADIWSMLTDVGFGEVTGSGFPGETHGYLSLHSEWSDIHQATMAFGYGISVTALQLARAYTVFATDGVIPPFSFLRPAKPAKAKRVFSAATVQQVRLMLEAAVNEGTGKRAKISGYRVAGKTGTVRKNVLGSYADNRYISLFAGIAPVSNPRFVAVVVVDEPRNGKYYGGLVAAPVFSNVMAAALRLFNVPPDDLSLSGRQFADLQGPVK